MWNPFRRRRPEQPPEPPKDEQSWKPGDIAEAVKHMTKIVDGKSIEPGARFMVTDTTILDVPWGPDLYLGMAGLDAWAQASCFRKIIPTFEEPKRAERAPAPDDMVLL